MIVDDRRPADQSAIGCQNSLSARGFRCSIEKLSPTKIVGEICKHSLVGDRSIGEQSPTSLQWLPIIFSG